MPMIEISKELETALSLKSWSTAESFEDIIWRILKNVEVKDLGKDLQKEILKRQKSRDDSIPMVIHRLLREFDVGEELKKRLLEEKTHDSETIEAVVWRLLNEYYDAEYALELSDWAKKEIQKSRKDLKDGKQRSFLRAINDLYGNEDVSEKELELRGAENKKLTVEFYKIVFSENAFKQLKELQKLDKGQHILPFGQQFLPRLNILKTPTAKKVLRLMHGGFGYRISIGIFRVIVDFEEENKLIKVLLIATRDIYKK